MGDHNCQTSINAFPYSKPNSLSDRQGDVWKAATSQYAYNILKCKTTDGKILEIHTTLNAGYTVNDRVFIDGSPAASGKYKLGWMEYLSIEDGKIKSL